MDFLYSEEFWVIQFINAIITGALTVFFYRSCEWDENLQINIEILK